MSRFPSAYLLCLLLYLRLTTIKCETTTTPLIASTVPKSTTFVSTTTPASSTTLSTPEPTDAPTTMSPPSSTPTTVISSSDTTTSTLSEPTPTPITQTPTSTTITQTTTPTTITQTTTPTTITQTTTPTTATITTTLTTTSTVVPISTPTLINTVRSFTWTDSNGNNQMIFEVEEGYFVSATVSDIDMSNGNYLLIEGGNQHTEGATDGRVFANTVKGPISYLFKTNSVYAFCKNTIGDGNNLVYAKFTVKFERVGEGTTTVSTTTSTTTVSVPPTQKEDSVYITVNVTGKSYLEYNKTDVQHNFKQCVVDIANVYCENNDLITTSISTDYVMIADIRQCPYNWPDSSTCAQIKFKLPIFYNSSKWEDYQLSTEHLEAMWSRKDELDKQGCFSKNSFADYDEPNFELAIAWWAVGITLVIVAFVAFLWFLRIFSSRVKTALKRRKNNMRRNSDTVSIMSRKTDSVCSLGPHYLQDHSDTSTPKIFEI